MGQQRFLNLDAMRGICALSVVLFHCDGLFVRGVIFSHGYLAVDAFFVLSGFVIAHTYEKRLSDGMRFADFLRVRLKRLAPVYWAGTLLGTAMLAAVAAYKPAGTFFGPELIAALSVMAMLLVPQLTLGGIAYPANPVAWSLLGELIVNLLHARWLHAHPARVLFGLIVMCWSVCALYGYLNPYGWCFGGRASDVVFTPFRAIPGFLAGVLLFRAHCAGYLARLPSASPFVLLMIWVLIAEVPTAGPTPTFDLIVVTIASPLLIALLIRANGTAPNLFLWLGAISYPLYASHLSIVFLARYTPLLGFEHGPNVFRACAVVAATLGLAWLIHHFVEQGFALRPRTAGSLPVQAL